MPWFQVPITLTYDKINRRKYKKNRKIILYSVTSFFINFLKTNNATRNG